jgi:ATP-dependent 26S proteasome regulatory subunit
MEANMIPLNDPQRAVRADITPVEIDQSVDWSQVGGLDHHVRALKEMVMFPLMYPELFQKFSVVPPKGVLFYGPPGNTSVNAILTSPQAREKRWLPEPWPTLVPNTVRR